MNGKVIATFELNAFKSMVFKNRNNKYQVTTSINAFNMETKVYDYLQPALQHFSKIILEEETK